MWGGGLSSMIGPMLMIIGVTLFMLGIIIDDTPSEPIVKTEQIER